MNSVLHWSDNLVVARPFLLLFRGPSPHHFGRNLSILIVFTFGLKHNVTISEHFSVLGFTRYSPFEKREIAQKYSIKTVYDIHGCRTSFSSCVTSPLRRYVKKNLLSNTCALIKAIPGWHQELPIVGIYPKILRFLSRLGFLGNSIFKNETLGFFLGFKKNSYEK